MSSMSSWWEMTSTGLSWCEEASRGLSRCEEATSGLSDLEDGGQGVQSSMLTGSLDTAGVVSPISLRVASTVFKSGVVTVKLTRPHRLEVGRT